LSFKIDRVEVNLPCPNCGFVNRVKLGQISAGETITCSSCGVKINLVDKDGSVKKGIRDIQKSFDELERTLKKLGKVTIRL